LRHPEFGPSRLRLERLRGRDPHAPWGRSLKQTPGSGQGSSPHINDRLSWPGTDAKKNTGCHGFIATSRPFGRAPGLPCLDKPSKAADRVPMGVEDGIHNLAGPGSRRDPALHARIAESLDRDSTRDAAFLVLAWKVRLGRIGILQSSIVSTISGCQALCILQCSCRGSIVVDWDDSNAQSAPSNPKPRRVSAGLRVTQQRGHRENRARLSPERKPMFVLPTLPCHPRRTLGAAG
jgi:hypothetical protein